MNAYSFLLVDAALAGFNDRIDLRPAGDTPSWLCPLYEGAAVWTGPVLIDILAAEEAGALDHAMAIVNARFPQLHLSLIDTTMHFDELADHLRRFRSVYNREHENFSLRFADCLVLAALSTVFSPAQWGSLNAMLLRWSVHLRDGSLAALSRSDSVIVDVPYPLELEPEQIARLRDLFAPDRMIHCLRAAEHGSISGGYAEQYRWASDAYAFWQASANDDEIVWKWLTEAAFETRGKVLADLALKEVLANKKLEVVKEGIANAAICSKISNITVPG
jgi:hypothetical protein